MIRNFFVVLLACLSLSAFALSDEAIDFTTFAACPDATATNDVNFCASFKAAAVCRCSASLPGCGYFSMSKIYTLMLAKYRSLENACNSQHDTDPQTCIDDWNCYLLGGLDSHGNACSSTQLPCA
jgi:hypothetical protein